MPKYSLLFCNWRKIQNKWHLFNTSIFPLNLEWIGHLRNKLFLDLNGITLYIDFHHPNY